MDLSFSPGGDAFRQQVCAFIRDHYPPEMRVKNPYTDLTERLETALTRHPAISGQSGLSLVSWIINIKERSCPLPTKQLK